MRGTGNNGAISVDTSKTVLVPADVYERGAEEDYLRFNGMTLTGGEVAVASLPQNGIVAIMGVAAAEWDLMEHEHEKGGVVATSPLFSVIEGADAANGEKRGKREVNILLTAENAYIAVWEKELKMAEVLPDNTCDSMLYYMSVLGRRFKLKKFDINVGGVRAGIVADSLRRYFGKVRIVL